MSILELFEEFSAKNKPALLWGRHLVPNPHHAEPLWLLTPLFFFFVVFFFLLLHCCWGWWRGGYALGPLPQEQTAETSLRRKKSTHAYTYTQTEEKEENDDAALTSSPNAAGHGSSWRGRLQTPIEIVIGRDFTFKWRRRRFAGHTKMDKP